ncbi:MAG: hypothetical protein Q3Y17_02045, partial [Blautia sp.]|nr:hypothetical protein [Blautia sp.]
TSTSNIACLKIYSDNLHTPLCGIFGANSVNVARYASFIGFKSPTKYDALLAESNFRTAPVFNRPEIKPPASPISPSAVLPHTLVNFYPYNLTHSLSLRRNHTVTFLRLKPTDTEKRNLRRNIGGT